MKVGTFLLAALLFGHAFGTDFQVDPQKSMFAVVTQKAGFAASLAHNHFIAADPVTVALSSEEDPLSSLQMDFSTKVADLVVDDPTRTQTWKPRVEALAFLDGSFGEVPDKDRAKIRKSMLGKKQLQGDTYPEIKAKLIGVTAKASSQGSVTFAHELQLDITIRDKTVRKAVAANITFENGRLTIEAFAPLTFTEFDIKPYSAAFGAVANADTFYLMVHLEAQSS